MMMVHDKIEDTPDAPEAPKQKAVTGSGRQRDLEALVSMVDFAIYTAEESASEEALIYLRQVSEIVRQDLQVARLQAKSKL